MHEQFADLPALYALGALPASDKLAFEAHLTACAVCAAEVRGFAPVLEALASTTAESAPAPEVRDALLARIRTPRRLQATWLALAASAVLAVGLAWYAVAARSRVAALEAQLSVLVSPDTAGVNLAGQPARRPLRRAFSGADRRGWCSRRRICRRCLQDASTNCGC